MSSEHVMKGYDDELRRLNNIITEMGGLAESQLAAAIDAVVERDSDLAASVVEGDAKVRPVAARPRQFGLAPAGVAPAGGARSA